MRIRLIALILIFFSFSKFATSRSRYVLKADSCVVTIAQDFAISQVGVTEATGNNDGPEVAAYLKVTGLGIGYPYCAAGISWSFAMAGDSLGIPRKELPVPMTAGSQIAYDHARKNGYKSESNRPEVYDLYIWRRKDSYRGHIGWCYEIGEKGWVRTVEFNTSSGSSGSQDDGQGVWLRKRNILHPLGRLRTRGFVGFKLKPSDLCKKDIIKIEPSEILVQKMEEIRREEEEETLSPLEKFFTWFNVNLNGDDCR